MTMVNQISQRDTWINIVTNVCWKWDNDEVHKQKKLLYELPKIPY